MCSAAQVQPVIVVDGGTSGYYNDSLGTILDGSAPQFPLPLGIGDDPLIYPAAEPDLAAALNQLGNWLAPQPALNINWRHLATIPASWALNTETAVIYEINGGQYGFSNLIGDFDADNGIYVWVNGQYKFGARAPGLPSPVGQFEYTNVALGNLLPGTNHIQILREDSGISVGYQIRITGVPNGGTPHTCAPAPSGLVGWWRAENNGLDVTGAHDGSFPYGIAYSGGEAGQAFDFDSSFRRLSVPDSPAFQLTNAMTLEGWINPRASGGFVCFRGDNRPGLDTWVMDTYESGFVKFQIDDEANNYSFVRAPIALNQWQHVAATWDRASGDMKIYVNGALVEQTNTTVIPIGQLDPGSEPAIGIGNHGGTFHQFPMSGLVDEFAIYNRALAGLEILSIYNAGSAGKCTPSPPPPSCVPAPAGLVGWWRAEANGNDVTGTNNGGLANGAGFAPGNVGQSFSFDGADDHFDIPASPSLDVGTANGLTFETWVNPTSIAMQVVAEWNNGSGGVGSHLWLSVDHTVAGDGVGNIYVNLYDTTETSHGILSPAGVMTANEWQHIAVTYDKTTGNAVLYRNGTAVSSQNLGVFTPQTSYDIHLGYRASSAFSGTYFGGLMDEPSLYNRALGALEIQSIYEAGSAGKCGSPSPPACAPPSSSMVGWWKAEANASDANGTNNGAALNGVPFTSGIVGQSFYFDGVDDRVLIPSSTSLNFGPGADFSVEAWIKPEWATTDFGVQSIVNKRFSPSFIAAIGWEFGLVDGRLMCQLADAPLTDMDFSTFVAEGPDLRDGQFHHVALSIQRNNSSGGKLIVDGQVVLVFDPTSQPGDLSTSEPLRIGAHADAALNSHFTGAVDEVSVYNAALSEAEVVAIYNSGSAGKCAPAPVEQFIIAGPITNSANGHAYYLTREMSWHEAEALGVRLGGHLATINDDDENNWLFNTFSSWGETDRELWIGLTDEVNEGEWLWSSGSTSPYRHWLDGQPDNYGGEGEGEDYAHFWMPHVGAPPGTWNDGPGYLSHYGVIEVGSDDLPGPVAMPDAFSTGINTPVSFNAQKLLINDFDPNGLAVSIAGVSSNSALGGAIEIIAGRIHYSPPPGFEGNDQFSYAITNEQARAASGIVTVTVGRGGPVGLNITYGPIVDDGQFVVRFAGIPGLTYTIEASPYLEGGWTKVSSFTAPATDIGFGVGVFEFREPVTGDEARYYRTVYPSY